MNPISFLIDCISIKPLLPVCRDLIMTSCRQGQFRPENNGADFPFCTNGKII